MSYENALADLAFVAARFQGILELAPLLEKAGSIENTVREAEVRLVDLRQQADSAAMAIEAAQNATAAAIKDAVRITSEAKANAESVRSAAVEAADVIRSSASEVAQAYKAQAQAAVDDAEADIVLAREELARVRNDVATANQKLFDTQDQLNKLRASLT